MVLAKFGIQVVVNFSNNKMGMHQSLSPKLQPILHSYDTTTLTAISFAYALGANMVGPAQERRGCMGAVRGGRPSGERCEC